MKGVQTSRSSRSDQQRLIDCYLGSSDLAHKASEKWTHSTYDTILLFLSKLYLSLLNKFVSGKNNRFFRNH